MSGGRNWRRARDRDRAAWARAEQMATDAHLGAIEAASLGARAKQRPDKAALREIAARAVAKFDGKIRKYRTKGRR
jgi:hypothetical protein